MQYPLTIDQFQYPEFESGMGMDFIKKFINAINYIYEEGRKAKNNGLYFTAGMVKRMFEREYNVVCEDERDDLLFSVYTEYANEAWHRGVKDSGKVLDIAIEDIKIYPCFQEYPPKPEKMEQKEQYFTETGLLQSRIILDSRGNLIDGYISFLLAKKYGYIIKNNKNDETSTKTLRFNLRNMHSYLFYLF